MVFENLNLHTSDFRKEIEKFLILTSRHYWEKAIKKIETSSIFYRQYQYARNSLLQPITKYFEIDKKGQSVNKQRTPEVMYLAERSFIINKIVRDLNEKARRSIIS